MSHIEVVCVLNENAPNANEYMKALDFQVRRWVLCDFVPSWGLSFSQSLTKTNLRTLVETIYSVPFVLSPSPGTNKYTDGRIVLYNKLE